jgi:CRISPR/Cas system-associated exonuclease Cas4 (RecB family)
VIEVFKQTLAKALLDIAELEGTIILLVLLISTALLLGFTYNKLYRRKRETAGISKESKTFKIEGSKTIPVRPYLSDAQGLAGTPDALIIENGFVIPVERKPFAKKFRDRHIVQLLVYMRLVEEFEGKKPPYGYLILGPACRRVKIENTAERQAWLSSLLTEMRAIAAKESEAVPAPDVKKCLRCAAKELCKFRAG